MQYGYDRASNRTYREVPTDTSNKFDELYSHDGLYRLEDLKRGQLNGTHTGMTSTDFQQAWTLDETGNWSSFQQDDNGNGTWNLVQDRTANKVNEITVVNNTTGAPWGSPQYDKAGNMTRIPDPQVTAFGWNEMTVDNWYNLTVDEWYGLPVTGGQVAVYDAWNRLVRLDRDGTTLQATAYDALRRRIVVESYTDGTLDETRHTFFSADWQAIEERVDTETDAERQNVWGLPYIDDLILRDRDTTADGTLDERLYALQDANWNVTSICNTSGAIQERYAYNAYGTPIFLDAAYASRATSSFDWNTLFAGYHWNTSTGLYSVRHRVYSPALGTWLQRDPIGYSAGDTNLQNYVSNSPTSFVDPSGMEVTQEGVIPFCDLIALVAQWETETYPAPTYQRERYERSGSGLGDFPEWPSAEPVLQRAVRRASLVDRLTAFKNAVHGNHAFGPSGMMTHNTCTPQNGSYSTGRLGWHYIRTSDQGWIDLGHFSNAAYFAQRGLPGPVVKFGGGVVEFLQHASANQPWFGSDACKTSAHTREDWRSNRLGAEFYSWLLEHQSNHETLASALTEFFRPFEPSNTPRFTLDYIELPETQFALDLKQATLWPRFAAWRRAGSGARAALTGGPSEAASIVESGIEWSFAVRLRLANAAILPGPASLAA